MFTYRLVHLFWYDIFGRYFGMILRYQDDILGLYGILLPKLFRPTVRKNCSSDRENV